MKCQLITTIALIAGLGLAGTAFAQRHDDKPHGYNADVANAQKDVAEQPSATGGRHDEKPHGMTKKVAKANVAVKPTTTTPAVAPIATPEAKNTAQ